MGTFQDPALYRYAQFTFNSTDFAYGNKDTPGFLFQQQIKDIASLNIETVILPTTYYVFSSDYYCSCTINGQSITWPEGNYSATSWISAVTPLLTNTTITYNTTTGKLVITNAVGNASIAFNSNQLAHELLGFSSGTTTSGSGTLTAPFVAQFSGPNFVYLRSNLSSMFNNELLNFSANTTPKDVTPLYSTSQNIMAMIPITENTGSVVVFEDQSQRFFYFNDTSLRRVEFYFTLGNRSTPLTFNGQAFQVRVHGFIRDDANYTFNSINNPPM